MVDDCEANIADPDGSGFSFALAHVHALAAPHRKEEGATDQVGSGFLTWVSCH